MPYIQNDCGRRIAAVRIRHGYTQEQLADALNIDRTHLSKVESGKRAFSIDLLAQMAELLDISLDYLILGRKSRNAQMADQLDGLISQLETLREKL